MSYPFLHPDLLKTDSLPQKPTRDGFGIGLIELGEKHPNAVVLSADLTESTRVLDFKKKFPERFIQLGVSEQSMASIAAGLALAGKIPFICSYAMFSPGRNWEQIRTTICLNDAKVVIVGAHAGVSVGPDGATHQALEDISIMRPLPNLVVIVPCDSEETRKATLATITTREPVYLRLTREKTPCFTSTETPFIVGRAEIFREGYDVALIACGPLVHEALLAAELLRRRRISARVINNHTIKPLDETTLIAAAKECRAVVTIEEHSVLGGLGGAVAELLARTFPVPMEFIGVQNRFGESGTPRELLEHFRLTAPHIASAALKVIKRK